MNAEDQDERQQLIDGGPAAVAAIYERHRERLERIVTFRLDPRIRRRVDPGDILQEAWLEIARRVSDYSGSTGVSVFVWMRQLTLQTLVDVQRRHFRNKRDVNREIRLGAGDGDQTSLSIAHFLVDQITSPSAVAVRAEELQYLQQALNSMNETDREILALRHFEQLSNNQVAEILGLTATAASNRYLRAAARLGEILERRNSGPHTPA